MPKQKRKHNNPGKAWMLGKGPGLAKGEVIALKHCHPVHRKVGEPSTKHVAVGAVAMNDL